MKTRRNGKNKIKRTRTKRGGGGCFGAFCSTNNAVKNVVDFSKMSLTELSSAHGGLLLLRSEKTKKLLHYEFANVVDPKVKAKLNKEIEEINHEIKALNDEMKKRLIQSKEDLEKVEARLQSMKDKISNNRRNATNFFANSPHPPGVITGGGCARQS